MYLAKFEFMPKQMYLAESEIHVKKEISRKKANISSSI